MGHVLKESLELSNPASCLTCQFADEVYSTQVYHLIGCQISIDYINITVVLLLHINITGM